MSGSAWGSVFATAPQRNTYAVDTFTDLRNLTPPTGSASLEVDGGATIGDGFGGIFFWSASSALADDGVNVIIPNSLPSVGRWIRQNQIFSQTTLFRKNAIINGAFEIAQRGINFPNFAGNTFHLDYWQCRAAGTMGFTVSQDTDVPTVAQAGKLFINSLRLLLTTPEDGLLATPSDSWQINQWIEGYNWVNLAQRPITLSFWVKATIPGIYCCGLRDAVLGGASDAGIVFEYTINNANTWEKKIINIPASPVAGTWQYTNLFGAILTFTVANTRLSGNTTTPGVWTANDIIATTNQVNGCQTGATNFRITGVQLEPGSFASEFERRTFQEELALCERYYWKTFPYAVAPAQNAGLAGALTLVAPAGGANNNSLWVPFPKRLRSVTTPGTVSITTYNPSAVNANWRDTTGVTDVTAAVINFEEIGAGIMIAGAATAGHVHRIHVVVNAAL